MNGEVIAGTIAGPRSTEAQPRMSALRTALAGLIGNVLEWFDFAVYGYFASNIGHQFFPKSDPAGAAAAGVRGVRARLLRAARSAASCSARVGDRIGRRALLTLSIALMGGATLVLGLLPTYDQIGIAAPLLLMLMRVLQGFSLGGEFTGSMVYTTELASPLMRGLVSSSTAAGTTLGFILGSAHGVARSTRSLTPTQVDAWGWRIPFIGSIVLLRRRLVPAPRHPRDRGRREGGRRRVRRCWPRSSPTGCRSSRRSASSR